jgi:hypothetical protein
MSNIELFQRIEKLEKIITSSTITLTNPNNEDEKFIFKINNGELVLEHQTITSTIKNLETYRPQL